MFDPLFQLLAKMLEYFYSTVPDYAFAIGGLTTVVLAVFWPLTIKSTRATMEMRRIQPLIKAAQEKYAGDREKMNTVVMDLYRDHGVNPMAGCLPMFVQMPVFIVLFRVVQGITRRFDTLGYSAGQISGAVQASINNEAHFPAPSEIPTQTFHPGWLNKTSDLYQSLIGQTEMRSFGLDLARTPLGALDSGIVTAIPYFLMVVLVAALSLFQTHQIQKRTQDEDSETSSQQQMIMRIVPWMTPFFSLSLPAGVVVYFIVSSIVRIIQQAYITRTLYSDETLTAPIETSAEQTKDSKKPGSGSDSKEEQPEKESSKDSESAASRHGSRRPNVSTKRSSRSGRIASKRVSDGTPKKSTKLRSTRRDANQEGKKPAKGWDRAKRTRAPEE